MSELKWLALTPKNLSLGIFPDQSVVVQCHFDGNMIGLVENIGLAIRMSPAEAREIGRKLLRKADEAEALSNPN